MVEPYIVMSKDFVGCWETFMKMSSGMPIRIIMEGIRYP